MAVRRNARLRREYLYRKSLEGKERQYYERKRRIREALQEGKAIPTELTAEADATRDELALDDDAHSEMKTHMDDEYAAGTVFKGRIAHGMLTGAIISAALALELPGPGTIYLGQSLRFRLPVKVGDELTAQLEVVEKREDKKFVTLDCSVSNQHGKVVASGTAEVIAPLDKIRIERPSLPSVQIDV